MTKTEYIAALERALADLPQDTTAGVIADYERRFDAALATGSSEAEVARMMPNPGNVASTWWSTARGTSDQSRFDVAAFTSAQPLKSATAASRSASPAQRVGQVIASAIGLSFLNLFLLIPAFIYTVMMGVVFVVMMAMYGGGIVVTAAGLAGVDTVMLGTPAIERMVGDKFDRMTTGDAAAASEITISPGAIRIVDHGNASNPSVTLRRTNLGVLTGNGNDSRPLAIIKGMTATIVSIMLLLIWLVAIKYSFIAARRYAAFNIAVLTRS